MTEKSEQRVQTTCLLILTFIGLALGPYTIGRLSVAFDDLGLAILVSLGSNVIAAGFLLLAMRSLPRDEASRMERAEAAGEPLEG